MNLQDTYEELRAVLNHYDAIHRTAEAARTDHTTIERQISEIRRAYLDDIYADPTSKVKFSNQERREAEAQRRLETHWPELVQQEAEASERRRNAAAELERSEQALKTHRVLATLGDAQTRLELESMAVASMPRMIRR